MTILTGYGSFAEAYIDQFEGEVASIRELGEEAFEAKLRSADTIIHNAATISSANLDQCLAKNFDFTRHVVRQVFEHNPRAHFIYLSSMSILDPKDDTDYGDVLAMEPYAYSKYLAETFCLKRGMERLSCVRFSTLFYQDPRKDGLSKMVHEAVKKGSITIVNHGEARRNFLPLRVAASYVHKLTLGADPGQRVFNFAAPRSVSFREAADMLHRKLPSLKVENKTMAGSAAVLSEFGSEGVDAVGPVRFSLESEIAGYIETLKRKR